MTILVIKEETNEVVSRFEEPKDIYDRDLFSFRITDKWGGMHWYNASVYRYEVKNES